VRSRALPRARNFRFPEKSGFRGLLRRARAPATRGNTSRWSFGWSDGSRLKLSGCTCLQPPPRSPANSASRALVYLALFYFSSRSARNPRRHISIERSLGLSRLNETVLCVSINSAKRKTSGREGGKAEERQADTIGSPGVWQEGSFRRGIFLVYHGIN